ncbi:MAG: hypothetical protein FJ267_04655 [Planctomycetes bacterium]|nr:hypothetical protein [Planctomycetota bacterium]
MKKALIQATDFLPDAPVKPGDMWERSSEMNLGSGQVMSVRPKYEYIGEVETNGIKLDQIAGNPFEVSLSISGNPNAQLTKSELKVKESSETYLFDREKGVLVSKVSTIKIDGPLTVVVGGMELDGKVALTMESKTSRQK